MHLKIHSLQVIFFLHSIRMGHGVPAEKTRAGCDTAEAQRVHSLIRSRTGTGIEALSNYSCLLLIMRHYYWRCGSDLARPRERGRLAPQGRDGRWWFTTRGGRRRPTLRVGLLWAQSPRLPSRRRWPGRRRRSLPWTSTDSRRGKPTGVVSGPPPPLYLSPLIETIWSDQKSFTHFRPVLLWVRPKWVNPAGLRWLHLWAWRAVQGWSWSTLAPPYGQSADLRLQGPTLPWNPSDGLNPYWWVDHG